MYHFKNDYSEGCHPQILDALIGTNMDATSGYGIDPFCEAAASLIQETFQCPEADVHFLMGGTQANLTLISHVLRPYEAVITVSTGHINVHETGAVEATGHKVLTYPASDGKVTPDMLRRAVEENPDEHTVRPAMVYISNATEIGTIYSRDELAALRAACDKYGLYLYLDGARLGTALTSPENDLEAGDLPKFCDAFYVGGTKNGALFGEAMVIVNDALKPHFRHSIKTHGGMLAKGRLLGVQFAELFRDTLWFRLAEHANAMADTLQRGLVEKGVPLMVVSPTNQLFPIFSDEKIEALSKNFTFEIWGRQDETHSVIRLVTSWATPQEAVDAFLAAL